MLAPILTKADFMLNYKALAAAILAQAAEDSRKQEHREDIEQFLVGSWVHGLCVLVGLEPERYITKLKKEIAKYEEGGLKHGEAAGA